MSVWYAVHTHPREEQKALINLQRQGYSVYLPLYTKIRRHARRIERIASPLFPRYLFVLVDEMHQSWSAIRSTFGVSQVVCNGGTPIMVADSIIEAIRARENEKGLIALNDVRGFAEGERVRIVDGPLVDHHALFERVTDIDRVVILLELLGRKIRTKLPFEAIAAF